MASIVLTRIDSRLIHGQVVTKWVNQSDANKIVVVSDMLVSDPFMKSIYLMAAPPGITVNAFGLDEAIAAWNDNQFESGKVLLLFGNLTDLHKAWHAGLAPTKVQVGGLGGGPERKVVFQNITLDDPDVDILKDLSSKGVEIIFQTIPEDRPKSFQEILKKY